MRVTERKRDEVLDGQVALEHCTHLVAFQFGELSGEDPGPVFFGQYRTFVYYVTMHGGIELEQHIVTSPSGFGSMLCFCCFYKKGCMLFGCSSLFLDGLFLALYNCTCSREQCLY